MKLIMTLLVRDEEDILEENLIYHLNRGVDYFIVTNNLSRDKTPEILQKYSQKGLLYTIHENTDNYSQSRWVSRMAQLASDVFGADWIIHSDADEFWWVEENTSFKDILNQVPEGYEAVKVQRHDFVPVESSNQLPFYSNMVYRKRESLNSRGKTLPPKICHRAGSGLNVSQGNHAVYRNGERLKEWETDEILILHFPLRSYSQFENKIRNGGAAYERNKELPENVGNTWRYLFDLYKSDKLQDYYDKQVFGIDSIPELKEKNVIKDERLLNYFRKAGTTLEDSVSFQDSRNNPEHAYKNSDSLSTVSVLTRISVLEIPYLLSFINHYLNHHQVDSIYFIVKEISEIKEIRNYLKEKCRFYPAKIKINLIPGENSLWLKDNVEFIKNIVKEDFTFLVDADEYLRLKQNNNLKNYVQSCGEVVLFRWDFSVNDLDIPFKTDWNLKRGFYENTHKCLAKTQEIHELTDHTCLPRRLKDKVTLTGNGLEYVRYVQDVERSDPFAKDGLIIHYWSRSFKDTVLKMMYQKFDALRFLINRKYTSQESVMSSVEKGILPFRLKMLAYMSVMKKPKLLGSVDVKIDRKYENSLVELFIGKKDLRKIFSVYKKYKRNLKKLPIKTILGIGELNFLMPGENILNNSKLQKIHKTAKVFVIGLDGTGVDHLSEFLIEKGFCTSKQQGHYDTLLKLHKADISPGNISQTEKEFGDRVIKLFEGNNAFSGQPIPLLYKKLDRWFSGSKFILTIRDPDIWAREFARKITSNGGCLPEAESLLFGRSSFDEQTFKETFENFNNEVLTHFSKRKDDLLVIDICEHVNFEEKKDNIDVISKESLGAIMDFLKLQ